MYRFLAAIAIIMLPYSVRAQQAVLKPQVIDSLFSASLANVPELRIQNQRVAYYDQLLRREKKSWMNSFNVGVQFLSLSYDSELEASRLGILPNLGVSLQIGIANLFTTKNNIRAAKAEKQIAVESRAIAYRELRQWFIDHYAAYRTALDKANARKRTLETIKSQMALIEQRFKQNEIDLNTYLEWQNGYEQAWESYREARVETEKVFQTITNRIEPVVTEDAG